MVTRKPCVANRFYPGEKAALEKTIKDFLDNKETQRAVSVIAPHAGYIYSGKVAGHLYSSVSIPDNVILIGPNHTGMGARSSVMAQGEWETPLGNVKINTELAYSIIGFDPHNFTDDMEAHMMEHSLEVQLPFLRFLNPKVNIVPITVMQAPYPELLAMGDALAKAVSSYKGDVLIVVSSDMNHYEDQKNTEQKDKKALDMILKLDERGLLETAYRQRISMCGVFPAAIAIAASKTLGAKKARLSSYATSGEVSGDYGKVVGYAGVIIN